MRVLTTAPDEVRELLAHWSEDSSLVVVALCAAWCDTCNEFRASFEQIAEVRPHIVFVWLDIEDDSDVCGDIDLENFPTLAIYRGDALLHFGVSLPQQSMVARLVSGYVYAGKHREREAYQWSLDTTAYVRSDRRGMRVGK